MKLTRGECVINKTRKYFLPILNTQPKPVIEAVVALKNSGGILGYGVQDYLYNDAKGIEHTVACLFIVVDRNGAFNKNRGVYVNIRKGEEALNNFLSVIRTQGCYVHDYIFDSVKAPNQHCIVLYMGEEWHKAYEAMKKGEYSKMYSLDDLKKCHINPTEIAEGRVYYILTHNPAYFPFFKARLAKEFNLRQGEVDKLVDDEREYDTPFNLSEETFNYKKLNVVIE